MKKAYLFDVGQLDYKVAWDLQLKLWQLRILNAVPDVLVLVEHPHVLTVGRRGTIQNVHAKEIPVYEIERGGDVTYHGPGQQIGYPIVSLEQRGKDIHQYLRDLEEVIIGAVSDFGIRGERHQGHTGVWVDNTKLASIGVAVRSWVTFHGFALNANTDLSYFNLIQPCGLDSSVMTSMERLTDSKVSMENLKASIASNFGRVFQKEMTVKPDPEEVVRQKISLIQ